MAKRLDRSVDSLWKMRNGYALCTADGLNAIGELLDGRSDAELDLLRSRLAIGLHSDVEVTDGPSRPGPRVSQAFCSALPVAYSSVPAPPWAPFARLVLEAAYEATLLAVSASAEATATAAGRSRIVLLTRLGGGAFGNDDQWIDAAIEHALIGVEWAGLDVRLVSHGSVHPSMKAIADRWHV